MRPENNKHSHFVVVVDSISYLCSCMSNISHGIICRHYFQVMMHSRVAEFHIQMIPVRWYNNEWKDKEIVNDCCFTNQELAKNQPNEILPINLLTMPNSVTCVLCYAAQWKVKYKEVWELAWHATQLAVEHDNHNKMVVWLKEFIGQHKETADTLTRSVQNWNPQEPLANNENKKNELESIENLLVL